MPESVRQAAAGDPYSRIDLIAVAVASGNLEHQIWLTRLLRSKRERRAAWSCRDRLDAAGLQLVPSSIPSSNRLWVGRCRTRSSWRPDADKFRGFNDGHCMPKQIPKYGTRACARTAPP
jgi:hypothetical protein